MTRSRTALLLAVATVALVGVPARVPASAPYEIFFAGMHNHTGYSDGVPGAIPADAYALARQNGLDIMTTTEHSEGFDVPATLSEQCLPTEGGTLVECALADGVDSFRKWDANLEQAQAATSADFLALRGFEWTSDVFDHINVYFSAKYTNAKIDGGYLTMDTFWKWFADNPDAIATFNHPGDKGDSQWNDFAYVPDADFRMAGIEVFNGGKSKDYFESGFVPHALDKGWHLGLVGAQDTHTDDWGDPAAYARTGFLVPELSPGAVRNAMLARRFYATTDANLELSFDAEGEPMGARLNRPPGTQVALNVSATDPDGESISSIELFSTGGELVAAASGDTASFSVTSGWGERWYLVRITQADGEKAYSSPVWIGANSHPGGEWLAGDLHVHTQNGHDTCVTPLERVDGSSCNEPWTWSFSPGERIALAKERGLDYLAITDHNNILSQSDPAWAAEVAKGELLLVPAYENSLPGHAQMLGATHC
ncbi:MAG: CehA/McbA family metallohydrolase, partial [Actinomycetota bacterium]